MYTVVAQSQVPAPPAEVWDFLTRPQRLARWFADASGFGPGGRFRFDFGDGDFHHGRVTEWQPAVALSFRWSFLDLGPASDVTWALLRRKAGTEVSIIDRGALTVLEAECLRVGWSELLQQLGKVVSGRERARFDWRRMITFTARLDGDREGVLAALSDPGWYRRRLAGVEAEMARGAGRGAGGPIRARVAHPAWGGAATLLELRPERVAGADYLYVTHDGWGNLPPEQGAGERRRFVGVWRQALSHLPVS